MPFTLRPFVDNPALLEDFDIVRKTKGGEVAGAPEETARKGRLRMVPKGECDFVQGKLTGGLMSRVFLYAKTLFLSRLHGKRGCMNKVAT